MKKLLGAVLYGGIKCFCSQFYFCIYLKNNNTCQAKTRVIACMQCSAPSPCTQWGVVSEVVGKGENQS